MVVLLLCAMRSQCALNHTLTLMFAKRQEKKALLSLFVSLVSPHLLITKQTRLLLLLIWVRI